MGEGEKKSLIVIEMRCLKSIRGVTWMDKVRDEEVRRTGVFRDIAGRAK